MHWVKGGRLAGQLTSGFGRRLPAPPEQSRRMLCMPVFQDCPGIAEVVLQFVQPDGSIAENALHFSNGGVDVWPSGDLTTLANAVGTWWATGDGSGNTYKGIVSEHTTLANVIARDLTVEDSNIETVASGVAGEDTSVYLPNGVTWSITHRTGKLGRVNRGRTFVIGLCEDSQDTSLKNSLDATVAANQILAFGALIPAIPAANAAWYWGVLSRRLDKAVRATGVITPITSVGYANLNLDYQRRRAPGHNRHRA